MLSETLQKHETWLHVLDNSKLVGKRLITAQAGSTRVTSVALRLLATRRNTEEIMSENQTEILQIWLQSKYLESKRRITTEDGDVEAIRAEELHEFLRTLDAPLIKTLRECERRGWVQTMELQAPGQQPPERWYWITYSVLDQLPVDKVAWHGPDESPPDGWHGPLTGQKKELADWICRTADHRVLDRLLRSPSGGIWGRLGLRTKRFVWFKLPARYAEANARHLADAPNQPPRDAREKHARSADER